MAVEKLTPGKMIKKTLRQDALQTIFSGCLDIFYPPNSDCFAETGLFQQPQAFTLIYQRHADLRPVGVFERTRTKHGQFEKATQNWVA